jgi:hypothetical protein
MVIREQLLVIWKNVDKNCHRLTWSNWGKPPRVSIRIAGIRADFRKQDLQNYKQRYWPLPWRFFLRLSTIQCMEKLKLRHFLTLVLQGDSFLATRKLWRKSRALLPSGRITEIRTARGTKKSTAWTATKLIYASISIDTTAFHSLPIFGSHGLALFYYSDIPPSCKGQSSP